MSCLVSLFPSHAQVYSQMVIFCSLVITKWCTAAVAGRYPVPYGLSIMMGAVNFLPGQVCQEVAQSS